MIFDVRVTPRASRNRVEQVGNKLKVYLTSPAQDGRANNQLIDLLSAYFKIKKYKIIIKSGDKSRNKLVSVDADI
ncbi:MAG: DUF167 domain-containing protein [Candidatus Omnitrophota bacterium]